MEDPSKSDSKSPRFLNPWVLNFQKLGLELKCPLCLNLLNRPVLLPCDHVFCQSCVPGSEDCSVCKAKFTERDLRHLPFIENMATIYRCLDATFSTNFIQPTHLGGNSCSRQSISQRIGVDQNANMDDMDLKLVAQSSPDSPPSFGDAKGSDSDSYLQCVEHSSENSLVKRASQENNESRLRKLRNDSSCLDSDVNFREAKRHKQLNYETSQMGTSKDDHIHGKEISHSRILMTNSDLELQKTPQPISVQAFKTSDDRIENTAACAFCHSSKISEETGFMLHYSNGKLVAGQEATHSSVIHVHKLCIDWAPQVFFADDKVKNLKKEVARGAKLRCSKCGQKGAALGCYVKSCRKNYHVPCAKGIAKCRWDHENYLILCPTHSSVRFPAEKLKFKKNISKDLSETAIVVSRTCQLSNRAPIPDGEKTWVLCGSALSTDEKSLMVKFGKMNDVVVSKFWNPNVTHVIAATDEKGACTRTLKFLMAILNGSWIVKVDWIRACIEAKCHVDEEPFEVSLDNYGCCDGPKSGRLRASHNEPKLFSGLNFYFVGGFVPTYLEDLQDLVIAAGGTLTKSREEMWTKTNQFVVYNIDPPGGCKLGEEVSTLWERMNEAEELALQTGSKVIGHTWLLESIAAHKLQLVV